MTTKVLPNFFACLMRLQEKNKKVYSWQDVGSALGMSRQAAQSLFIKEPPDTGFVRYSTIAGLLDFFAREGMPVTINDLFVTKAD